MPALNPKYSFMLIIFFLRGMLCAQLPNTSMPNFNRPSSFPQVRVNLGPNRSTIEQNNMRALIQTGDYVPPAIPPSDPSALGDFMRQQNPQLYGEKRKQQEVQIILDEIGKEEIQNGYRLDYYKSEDFKILSRSYGDAFTTLNNMLAGKKSLSVKDAYYAIEAAYGEPYLTKEEYDQRIKASADFIKKWLQQNGYDPRNADHLHLGIQQFMRKELTITITKPDNENPSTLTHQPFFYDYTDFSGEHDFRNYFVTKALATNGGQCNSLPVVYLVLAEALGVKAWLSFAPQHSLIKYRQRDGRIYNYEPTSGWNISDQWYVDNMFISQQAQKSRIYLDTLNKKQVVANCLIDLCFGYVQKFGVGDAAFSLSCLESSAPFFPKANNIYFHFMRSEIIGRMLVRTMAYYRITVEQVAQYPDAAELYKLFVENEEAITRLGYVRMPETMYQQIMDQHRTKEELQQQQNISGKEKREPFTEDLTPLDH